MSRHALAAALLLGLSVAEAAAFEQPPIQGPQDQACRNEATAKVFDAPDPDNLGLHAIGKQIYFACMARLQAAEQAPVRTARRTRKAA